MVKGAGVALPAEHGHAIARVHGTVGEASAVVGVLAGVEVADGPVEELAGLVGALVVVRAGENALLGEESLLEALDLVRDDVGDEVGLLDVGCGHGVASGHEPCVLLVVHSRHEVACDDGHGDDLLVAEGRVGLPEGDDLLHSGVEEGGADLGEVRLNYEAVGVRHLEATRENETF